MCDLGGTDSLGQPGAASFPRPIWNDFMIGNRWDICVHMLDCQRRSMSAFRRTYVHGFGGTGFKSVSPDK